MNIKVFAVLVLGGLAVLLPLEVDAASPILTVLAKHKKAAVPAPIQKPLKDQKKVLTH